MNIEEAKKRAENTRRMSDITARLSRAKTSSAKRRAAAELTRIGIESALKLAPAMSEEELFNDFDILSEDDFAKKYSGVLVVPIYEQQVDEGLIDNIKGVVRREKAKRHPIIQSRGDYAHGKAAEEYLKGKTRNGDRYADFAQKEADKRKINEEVKHGTESDGYRYDKTTNSWMKLEEPDHTKGLSQEHKELLSSIINRSGGGGPVATPHNLKFVNRSHVKKSLNKLDTSKLSDLGKKIHGELVSHYSKPVSKKRGLDPELIKHYADKGITVKEETMISEGAGDLSDAARELTLHADNDRHLHMTSHEPIMKNLRKKVKAGTYDPKLAKKLWRYHADRAAQDYAKKHGNGVHWSKMFTPADREQAASHWEEMHRGDLSEETISELSKTTLRRYTKAALNPSSEQSVSNLASRGGFELGQAEPEDAKAGLASDRKSVKRSKGVDLAIGKLMKEETEMNKQTPQTAAKRNINVEREIMEIMSQGRDVRMEAKLAEAKAAGILKEDDSSDARSELAKHAAEHGLKNPSDPESSAGLARGTTPYHLNKWHEHLTNLAKENPEKHEELLHHLSHLGGLHNPNYHERSNSQAILRHHYVQANLNGNKKEHIEKIGTYLQATGQQMSGHDGIARHIQAERARRNEAGEKMKAKE